MTRIPDDPHERARLREHFQRVARERPIPEPDPAFAALRDHVAFDPARIACFLGEERVRAQPGGYYGGWVTDEIRGPVKGAPGSERW